jgi:dTDP-4-amino-4,6-dideoxygalactose transaminase
MSKWKITLSQPDIDNHEIKGISEVVRSKWLTMSKLTEKFERQFAKFIGSRYAIFVSSGTAALHLACRALEIGLDDEVICPSLSFVATSNAILYVGAKPVFADIIGIDNFNISIHDIRKKITARTKAIIVVHYGGYPCAMDKIRKLANKFNLFIIEDSAHAIGAMFKGRSCGLWGDVGVFSFFANKNMTTAEGGMLVTNQALLAKKIRLLRSHAMDTTTWDRYKGSAVSYDVLALGYNYRPSEINAALGLSQLRKLSVNNNKRRKLTFRYREQLGSGNDDYTLPFQNSSGRSSYHIFPLLLSKTIDRDKLINRLKRRGIQTSIHYPAIHKFSYYRKILKENIYLPNTEYISKHEITLPLFPQMRECDVDYVADVLKQEIKHCRLTSKEI